MELRLEKANGALLPSIWAFLIGHFHDNGVLIQYSSVWEHSDALDSLGFISVSVHLPLFFSLWSRGRTEVQIPLFYWWRSWLEKFNHTASQRQSLDSDPVSAPHQRPWLGGNFHYSGFIRMSEKTLGQMPAQRKYKHNFISHREIGKAL